MMPGKMFSSPAGSYYEACEKVRDENAARKDSELRRIADEKIAFLKQHYRFPLRWDDRDATAAGEGQKYKVLVDADGKETDGRIMQEADLIAVVNAYAEGLCHDRTIRNGCVRNHGQAETRGRGAAQSAPPKDRSP